MMLIFLILVGIQGSTAVTHSLKYFYTASSGIENFPSYVSVGLVDEVQISYCDSRTNENIPKQDWMNKVNSKHPNYWEEETETCWVKQRFLKGNLEIAKHRFNQTGGEHIYQQMYGCEWDDETGEVKGYDEFGYDGEDLIILDSNTQQWIAPRTQAVITANRWNNDRNDLEHENEYLTQTCVEWLRKYVNYGRRSLMRTDLPSVSLLQKSPSSPVSCFATGFYPNRAEMFWRKDGEEIHDGVEKGEIKPNNDGTFQMSVNIDLSSVATEDWNKYECVFQLSGVNDITNRLEKTRILTNESNIPIVIITFVLFVTVLGLIAVIGFILYNQKNNARRPPSRK
uniref:H-2 class I histocompatibility antigen, Q9 alpha chain-like n=1 Tax=Xiphophorus maculatus TaxID=8083 RepID=A0A3B5QT72_XIPMA